MNRFITAVEMDYVCRTCGYETAVLVMPDKGDDGQATITHSHKLTRQPCVECEAERTFVLAAWLDLDLTDRPGRNGTER